MDEAVQTSDLVLTAPAVVPIFVNVGAAVLPAVAAWLASVVAPLLRPRELLRLFRRKPYVPLLLAGGLTGLWFGGSWLYGLATAATPADRQAVSVDWADVARAILRHEAAVGAAAFAPAQAVGEAPTIFRTDASRDGYDGGPAPRDLTSVWRFQEYPDEMVLSSPAVVGSRVYGATCALDLGANYGTVFCLDAETGRKIWLTETAGDEELKGFFSSPAVTADGRYLVIGQGLHYDKDCALLCFDAATGALHWRVETPLHIESSPAIRGDVVVVGAGAIEDENMKPVSDPGFVLAVRISTGEVLWRYPVTDPESSPVFAADGTVYVGSGFNGKAVVALRSEPDDELASRGLDRVLWTTPTPYPATGAVTLVGDLVIVGGGNGNYVYADPNPAGIVLALDRATGRVRWKREMPDAVLGAVAAREGTLLCAVRNGRAMALSLEDGEPLWPEPRAVSGREALLAAPALAGDLAYLVSRDGYLAILRASDGSLLEKHYINAEGRPGEMGLSLSSPTVAGGRVFVGSETGGLWCFAGRAAE
ncbi:MAG: PQQ-binding-like beta-propeller repeat protein [Phycisphaerae bacterium]